MALFKIGATYVLRPRMNENTATIKKTTNKICAMDEAEPAIPPKPNTAAMIAIIKNVTAQLNMVNLHFFPATAPGLNGVCNTTLKWS